MANTQTKRGHNAESLQWLCRWALAAGFALTVHVVLVQGAEEAQTGPTVAVNGTVVDTEGKPVPGAGVYGVGPGMDSITFEAVTDNGGRFRLDVPARPGTTSDPDLIGLWAYQPGKALASVSAAAGTLASGVPVRLVVGPSAKTVVEVRKRDDRPVEGATVAPRVILSNSLTIPEALARRIGAATVTDDRGRAEMLGLWPEELNSVVVAASGFGRQLFQFPRPSNRFGSDSGVKIVRLFPVGRVVGRIVGEADLVRGRKLIVSTHPRPGTQAFAEPRLVTTDGAGHFEVTELAEGEFRASLRDVDPKSPWPGVTVKGQTDVMADRTSEVEIVLTRGVRVRGIVRERDTGKPIAEVKVMLDPLRETALTTDVDGRYETYALPRLLSQQLKAVPEGYAGLLFGIQDVDVPPWVVEFDLPPIELARAGVLRGLVTDDTGDPVPGATVEASWGVNEGLNRIGTRTRTLRADSRGVFRIGHVPLDTNIRLTARSRGLATPEPIVTWIASVNEPPDRLRLVASRNKALSGRVLGPDGAPISGARVRLLALSPITRTVEPINFDGLSTLITDAEGVYRIPDELNMVGVSYHAVATADDHTTEAVHWNATPTGMIPNMTLRYAVASLPAGRVRDRHGQPVASAVVWTANQPPGTSFATTEVNGRFTLSAPIRVPTLLFVEKDGHHFHGELATTMTASKRVWLTPSDEPPPEVLKTIPPDALRDVERADLCSRLETLADQAARADDEPGQVRVLTILAAFDPDRVLKALAAGRVKDEGNGAADRIRAALSRALLRPDPAKADAVIGAIQSPGLRASAVLEAHDFLPEADRAGKLARLDEAERLMRTVKDRDTRIELLGRIALRRLALRDLNRATDLLQEGRPIAREVAQTWALEPFVGALAAVDPGVAQGSLDRVAVTDDPDRLRLRIARTLASRDPAGAEQVLRTLSDPVRLARSELSAIAYAMAPKDLARARRLVDTFGLENNAAPFARAHARGMMALALADHDQATAAGLLDEAFLELKRLTITGARDVRFKTDAASVAAALLPVVEQVAPKTLSDRFWLAASLPSQVNTRLRTRETSVAELALLLARYNREVARNFLTPLMARGLSDPAVDHPSLLWAVASLDARQAIARIDTRREAPFPVAASRPPQPSKSPRAEALLDLAEFLAIAPDQRWDAAVAKRLGLWNPGRGDD